jgi:mannan endo-1,4-beta-mannosidase
MIISRVLCFAFILIFLACKSENPTPIAETPKPDQPFVEEVDESVRLKDRSRLGIIKYIATLASNQKVLTGQQCGNGDDAPSDFNLYIENLFKSTNKYVGLLGVDYGWKDNSFNAINQLLINHWNQKGLVTISWHADNPWTDGYNVRWNSAQNKETINLNALLKTAPMSKAKTNYRAELARVAEALQQLKNAGVVVIWRPFHEMNGDWFWWGISEYVKTPSNVEAYKNLWKDLHETLTKDYGLTNLIWTYGPNHEASWSGSVTVYYPGEEFVDLVGEDYYGPTPSFPDYEALKALGKPLVLCEGGPNDKAYGNWDEVALVNTLKGKAGYFLQWASWPGAKVAIIDNLFNSNMMRSKEAVTRDEL